MRFQLGVFRVSDGGMNLDAVELVAARLVKLEAARARMLRVHTLVLNRNAKGLKRLGYARSEVARLLLSERDKRCAFHVDFKLWTNYQQIVALRRLALDFEALEMRDVSIDQNGYLYREDACAQTIAFRFAVKPDKALRALLRRDGFVLRLSRNTFGRPLDLPGIAAASGVAETAGSADALSGHEATWARSIR